MLSTSNISPPHLRFQNQAGNNEFVRQLELAFIQSKGSAGIDSIHSQQQWGGQWSLEAYIIGHAGRG